MAGSRERKNHKHPADEPSTRTTPQLGITKNSLQTFASPWLEWNESTLVPGREEYCLSFKSRRTTRDLGYRPRPANPPTSRDCSRHKLFHHLCGRVLRLVA